MPDWLTGLVVQFSDRQVPKVKCRQCGENLCTIEQGDQLWVLVDVARDHRIFCRDAKERLP